MQLVAAGQCFMALGCCARKAGGHDDENHLPRGFPGCITGGGRKTRLSRISHDRPSRAPCAEVTSPKHGLAPRCVVKRGKL